MDAVIEKAMAATAGLVVIPNADYVVVVMGIVPWLQKQHYGPKAFRIALMASQRQAMITAKEFLALMGRTYGRVDIGTHESELSFHRLDLTGSLVGIRGTLRTKEIRIH